MKNVRSESVNTHNANGERFVLTIGDDDSVTVYDNYKRKGFGLYCGDDCESFMGGDSKISKSNFILLLKQLNDLYLENISLLEEDSSYEVVLNKLDLLIQKYEDEYLKIYGKYL